MFIAAQFLSTPSARRATRYPYGWEKVSKISIHALREEGDRSRSRPTGRRRNFYPRPPRGGRPFGLPPTAAKSLFLSTPSARRATIIVARSAPSHRDFYPRPPRGGRRLLSGATSTSRDISIHALREEGDVERPLQRLAPGVISIHALREEGDFKQIAAENGTD